VNYEPHPNEDRYQLSACYSGDTGPWFVENASHYQLLKCNLPDSPFRDLVLYD
jgi:hypothetical protein